MILLSIPKWLNVNKYRSKLKIQATNVIFCAYILKFLSLLLIPFQISAIHIQNIVLLEEEIYILKIVRSDVFITNYLKFPAILWGWKLYERLRLVAKRWQI